MGLDELVFEDILVGTGVRRFEFDVKMWLIFMKNLIEHNFQAHINETSLPKIS
jgi:hypothetical protein